MHAAMKGHLVTVQYLVSVGANVEAVEKVRHLSVPSALWRRLCLYLLWHLILIVIGFFLCVYQKNGTTALMRAAQGGHTATVQYLLSLGAHSHQADKVLLVQLFSKLVLSFQGP